MVAVTKLLLIAGAALAAAQDILLPKPAGPYNVTVRTSELIDTSRLENSTNAPAAAKKHHRRLMVSMFSPVVRDTASCRSPYMLPKVAHVENVYWQNASAVPNATVRFKADFNRFKLAACSHDVTHGVSHNVDDGSTHGKDTRFPLLFFSPGYGATRSYYHVLAQYIAASGFVVLSIDHPYSIDAIEFPNGDLIASDPNPEFPDDPTAMEFYLDATNIRRADVSFLADQLGHNATFRNLIYPRGVCHQSADRIGIYGHSLGGGLAADAMLFDKRFKGGVNYDGEFFGYFPNSTTGISDPFVLWFDERFPNRTVAPTFEDAYNNIHAFKRNPELKGARHLTFGDPKLLADLYPFNPLAFAYNNITGQRVIDILSRYTRDFFRLALEGKGPGLLAGPNPKYPEVAYIP